MKPILLSAKLLLPLNQMFDWLSNHSGFQSLREICSAKKTPMYLSGGIVRGFLWSSFQAQELRFNDVDVVIIAPESAYRSIVESFNDKHVSKSKNKHEKNLDVVRSGSLQSYLQRFDVTINALAVDCSTREVFDVSGRGISDLERGELVALSPSVILSDPVGLMRLFRLSAECGYQLSPDLRSLLSSFPHCFQIAGDRDRCSLFAEFFRLLSLPSCERALYSMHETGYLIALLPELAQKLSSSSDSLRASFSIQSKFFAKLPPENRASLLRYEGVSLGIAKRKVQVDKKLVINQMAIARFLGLFDDLASYYVALEKNMKTPVTGLFTEEQVYCNCIQNIADRVTHSTALQILLKKLALLMPYVLEAKRAAKQPGEVSETVLQALQASPGVLFYLLALPQIQHTPTLLKQLQLSFQSSLMSRS